MVTLRNSNIEDLDFIITAETSASKEAFVISWPKERHVSAFNNESVDHMIIENQGESVGYLIANRNADDNYELMRIVVSKRGFGYGKKAIKLLLNFAFEKLKTHRFWLDVRMHNEKAIALYKNLGFVEEGILREAVRYKEGYVSVMVMSILRSEYEI